MPVNGLRILTLLARHGTSKYPKALSELRQLFERQVSGAVHDVLVIDNALPSSHLVREDRIELIGGSNAAWEFSAWDAGIAHVGSRLEHYDLVVLATSAFRQLDPKHLDALGNDLIAVLKGRFAATGHIDYYNVPVRLFGAEFQSWIRSSFVILPPLVLRRIGSLVSIADGRALFTGDPSCPFRREAPISENYRAFIVGWLTGEGTGQGTTWHSRFALNRETLLLFEQKTLAILNEQMLTHRLRAAGCGTIDITWFARQCREGLTPDNIPEWQVQLEKRYGDQGAA